MKRLNLLILYSRIETLPINPCVMQNPIGRQIDRLFWIYPKLKTNL